MKLRSAKRHLAMFGVNHIFMGTKYYSVKRWLLRAAGYEIGEGTKVVGPIVICRASLVVGKNCWIGQNLTIHGNGSVTIGDHCDLAPDITFFTGGHAIGGPQRRAGVGENYVITVGDGSWIGGRSSILKNVNIGKGSVIAACACVVSDVAENVLVGGTPAKVLREL